MHHGPFLALGANSTIYSWLRTTTWFRMTTINIAICDTFFPRCETTYQPAQKRPGQGWSWIVRLLNVFKSYQTSFAQGLSYRGLSKAKDSRRVSWKCFSITAFREMCKFERTSQELPVKDKKSRLLWSAKVKVAFRSSKIAIVDSNTTLSPNASLVLRTDASNIDFGKSLKHKFSRDTWCSLCFFSKRLSNTTKRYSVFDRELLTLFEAIEHFQRFLEGRSFTVLTDHRLLVNTVQQCLDKVSPRQVHQWDYTLKHQVVLKFIKKDPRTRRLHFVHVRHRYVIYVQSQSSRE